nr:hypothetical protein [Mycoplasmopsis bovis]
MTLKNSTKAIGKYALDNNIKIIQSSGNDNDELSKTMVDNNLLNRPEFMNNGIFHFKAKIYDVFKNSFLIQQKIINLNIERMKMRKIIMKNLLAKIRPVIDNAFYSNANVQC